MGWNASITDFGKWQKKLPEHSLQARQFSTNSIPYGECIAITLVGAPYRAESVAVDERRSTLALRGRLPLTRVIIGAAYGVQKTQICSILLTPADFLNLIEKAPSS
jgi:hypothetical protein